MTGSVIIYKGNTTNRVAKAINLITQSIGKEVDIDVLKTYPDIQFIEVEDGKKSIGIKQVKEGIAFLAQKPLSLKIKALVITPADYLTTEAQNALLKTLEEPPSYALILLLAKTEDSLLPTVQSRCKKIAVEDVAEEDSELGKILKTSSWEKITAGDIHKRMEVVEELSKEDREVVVKVLETWVIEERKRMTGVVNIEQRLAYAHNIQNILDLIADFENTYVGLRLGLESLILKLE